MSDAPGGPGWWQASNGKWYPPVPIQPPLPPPVAAEAPLVGPSSPLVIICAIGVIVGSLGPWITARTVFGSISPSGTEGDGVITLVLGIAALVMACIRSSNAAFHVVQFLVAGAAAGIALYDIVNINQAAEDLAEQNTLGISATVGWGLWLVLVGGGVAAIAQFVETRRR